MKYLCIKFLAYNIILNIYIEVFDDGRQSTDREG